MALANNLNIVSATIFALFYPRVPCLALVFVRFGDSPSASLIGHIRPGMKNDHYWFYFLSVLAIKLAVKDLKINRLTKSVDIGSPTGVMFLLKSIIYNFVPFVIFYGVVQDRISLLLFL